MKENKTNLRNRGYGVFKVGDTYHSEYIPVGTKIKFAGEKQRYTVRASNRFFSVCTKPFNARKTVIYTIIDWHHQMRGTENLVFGRGAETDEECADMLERLTLGKSEVSYRNRAELEIEAISTTDHIKSSKSE